MSDQFGRPDWDSYFMTLAFVIARRSIDPRTKHGAVLVAADKRVLSIGYNGPIRGSIDANIPLTGELKYPYMIHSEENCLLNYHGGREDLKGAIMFITGKPCSRCLRMMLQKGIKNIVQGPLKSFCVDQDDDEASINMLIGQNVNVKNYENIELFCQILQQTIDYLDTRVKQDPRVT